MELEWREDLLLLFFRFLFAPQNGFVRWLYYARTEKVVEYHSHTQNPHTSGPYPILIGWHTHGLRRQPRFGCLSPAPEPLSRDYPYCRPQVRSPRVHPGFRPLEEVMDDDNDRPFLHRCVPHYPCSRTSSQFTTRPHSVTKYLSLSQ